MEQIEIQRRRHAYDSIQTVAYVFSTFSGPQTRSVAIITTRSSRKRTLVDSEEVMRSLSLLHGFLLFLLRDPQSSEALVNTTSKSRIRSSVERGLQMTLRSSTAANEDAPTVVEANTIDLKQVKGIIFDIDGTLADSWRLGYDATLTVLERHNIPLITPEFYHSCTKYSTPERLARHAGYEPGHPLFEPTGRKLAQEFDDLYVSLVTTETAGLFEGILPLLVKIPDDVAVGALTNAAVRYAHAVLQTNCPSSRAGRKPGTTAGAGADPIEFYRRFRSIRGADDVPAPKPSPEGLWQVCRDLQLKPSDCVYVGDSPTDGVAAHEAGMPSVGVLWGSHSRESLSAAPFTRLVGTVQELEELLLAAVRQT